MYNGKAFLENEEARANGIEPATAKGYKGKIRETDKCIVTPDRPKERTEEENNAANDEHLKRHGII